MRVVQAPFIQAPTLFLHLVAVCTFASTASLLAEFHRGFPNLQSFVSSLTSYDIAVRPGTKIAASLPPKETGESQRSPAKKNKKLYAPRFLSARMLSSPLDQLDFDDFDNFPPNVKRKVCVESVDVVIYIPRFFVRNGSLALLVVDRAWLTGGQRAQYFSSLERLRLAQAASRPKTSSVSRGSHGVIKTPTSPRSLRPSLSRRNSSYFRSSPLLRSRNKTPSPTTDTFSPSDAQWFLRLPEKVQRKHFTPEERWLLSGLPDTVLPDAADERVYKSIYQLSREANRSVPTLRPSSCSSTSSISTFDAELEPDADSAIAMDDADFDGFRWIENDDDHDLASTLDPYHTFVNNTADHTTKTSKRTPSFRRALSMTSLPFGSSLNAARSTRTPLPTPIASPVVPQLPSLETIQQHVRRSSHRRSASRPGHLLPIHHNRTPSNPIEPSATHYTDPSARLKLRVYLASPQKFDEAIEFGFPSMEDKENMPLSRPSLTRSHRTAPSSIQKTFLDDSNPSIFDALDDPEDEGEDGTSSLPERGSPYTPVGEGHFTDTYLLSPSEAPSSSGSQLFFPKNILPNHSHHHQQQKQQTKTLRHNIEFEDPAYSGRDREITTNCNTREMTLRMTLTRPDLRVADDQTLHHYYHEHPSRRGEDPLALEHLPAPSSSSGQGGDGQSGDIWDSLPPVKEGGAGTRVLKRVWRKVSGKGY